MKRAVPVYNTRFALTEIVGKTEVLFFVIPALGFWGSGVLGFWGSVVWTPTLFGDNHRKSPVHYILKSEERLPSLQQIKQYNVTLQYCLFLPVAESRVNVK